MAFLIVGVLLLVMKMASFGPVAEWSWIWILLPFGLAVLWWSFSDSTGLTRRRAMERMEERKIQRRERDMHALGLNTRRETRVQAIRDAARRDKTKQAHAEPGTVADRGRQDRDG